MENFVKVAQIAVALSVAFVWIFRFHNVVKEFNQFGLSELVRSFVGAAKISLATLLVVGVWYPSLVFISSVLM
ncbi:MAG: DoxX family protein [Ignavibacteria bacterium]